MNNRPLQDTLPDDHGARVCFGCGADNPHGLRLKSYMEGGVCVATYRPKSYQTAFPGVLNGGVIATLLDCHGIWTAVGYLRETHGQRTMLVTAKLTVEFLKPTPIDRELVLKGRVLREGRSSVTATVDMQVDGETTARAEVVGVRIGDA